MGRQQRKLKEREADRKREERSGFAQSRTGAIVKPKRREESRQERPEKPLRSGRKRVIVPNSPFGSAAAAERRMREVWLSAKPRQICFMHGLDGIG